MTRWLMLAVACGCMAMGDQASAQITNYTQGQLNNYRARTSSQQFTTQYQRSQLINRSVPQYSFTQANRNIFSGIMGNRPPGKPFSGATGGGSVSPWLALSEPFSSSAHNYYTQVRPQLEQQRLNQQMAARNMQMQRQLNAMAAQGPYDPGGNENMAPTGHVAAYMNYGGYYQPVQPTKQQR